MYAAKVGRDYLGLAASPQTKSYLPCHEAGNFAAAVPLLAGDNYLELVIKSGGEIITTTQKTVHFDENFSTGDKRLVYVNSVALEEGIPALPGTIVINLNNETLLGLIEEKYVVGISPDGGEIYTSDRTVISTDTHQELRSLPFTQDILTNGFLVSPDGTHLYSRDKLLFWPWNRKRPADNLSAGLKLDVVPAAPTLSGLVSPQSNRSNNFFNELLDSRFLVKINPIF